MASNGDCANHFIWKILSRRVHPFKNSRFCGFAALAVAVSMALSACSTPSSPNVASVGSTTTTVASNGGSVATSSSPLLFAQCMRSHGVDNFPDPTGNGKFPTSEQLGVSNSQLAAAEVACVHLLPVGTNDRYPAAQRTQILSSMLRFSGCMRSNGVPNWPDPTVDSEGRPYFPVSSVQGLEHDYRLPARVMTSDGICHHLLALGVGVPLG